jgi:hypothetical protein
MTMTDIQGWLAFVFRYGLSSEVNLIRGSKERLKKDMNVKGGMFWGV